MSPEIPTDILYYLCEIIHTTLPSHLTLRTLKSCSLASRSFLDPARIRIFQKIRLNDASHLSFIEFTEANPHIALYVRDLWLEGTEAMLSCDHELGMYLRTLVGLEVLTVSYLHLPGRWGKFSQEVRSAMEWHLRGGRLKVLSLSCVQIPLQMLAACRALRKLEMIGVSLMADDDTLEESPSETADSKHTAQLECLKFSDSTSLARLLLDLASTPDPIN